MTQHATPRVAAIDPEAAALMLGVSIPTVRRLIAKGELTNHGTDRRFILDAFEVDRYTRAADK